VAEIDWPSLSRRVERRRKKAATSDLRRGDSLELMGRLTWVSFRLEGLEVQESEVVEALVKGGSRGEMRSRQAQRLRVHAAILLGIERSLRNRQPLEPETVLRWYTSISAGLSTLGLADAATQRMAHVCRRINSPPTRLQTSLLDISSLYCGLLADPLAPSFNGILARLLLRYHLGRCELPHVLFDATIDRAAALDPNRMQARLVALVSRQLGVEV
jgi:hypothetical protein